MNWPRTNRWSSILGQRDWVPLVSKLASLALKCKCLKWLLSPIGPLLLGYETCNKYEMVRNSKSRPWPLEFVWTFYSLSEWKFSCLLRGHVGLTPSPNIVDYWALSGYCIWARSPVFFQTWFLWYQDKITNYRLYPFKYVTLLWVLPTPQTFMELDLWKVRDSMWGLCESSY